MTIRLERIGVWQNALWWEGTRPRERRPARRNSIQGETKHAPNFLIPQAVGTTLCEFQIQFTSLPAPHATAQTARKLRAEPLL
jgi:hypothetical protein